MSKDTLSLENFLTGGITNIEAPMLYAGDKKALWENKISFIPTLRSWRLGENIDQGIIDQVTSQLKIGNRFVYPQPALVMNSTMDFIRAWVDVPLTHKNNFCSVTAILKSGKDREKGKLPRHYFIELQHAMICCGFESSYFMGIEEFEQTESGYFVKEYFVQEVKRDPVFCSNHVAECVLFWDHVRRGVAP